MKEYCLHSFRCLDQNRYGEENDCTLTSLTAVINYYCLGKHYIQNIYDDVETIARKYGYTGKKGTNPLFIRKIFNGVLHKYIGSTARSKVRYFKNVGFTFESICSLIDKNKPVIMSLWQAGKYHDHTITIIGYDKENNFFTIADNWKTYSTTLFWNEISFISSINWY